MQNGSKNGEINVLGTQQVGLFSTLVTDETAHKVSKEVYADDKLVSLYDMMLSLGSVNARVQGLEHDVHALSARNLRTSC